MSESKSTGGSGGKPVKKSNGSQRRGTEFTHGGDKKAGVYKPGKGQGGADTSNPPSGSKSSE